MAEKNNTEKDSGPDGHFVRIEHTGAEDTRTIYANHVLIQHNEAGEFFLSFFDMPPPIVMGTEEERVKQVEELSKLDAHCVARIGLTKERLAALIGAMAENLTKFSKLPSKSNPIKDSDEEKKHAS